MQRHQSAFGSNRSPTNIIMDQLKNPTRMNRKDIVVTDRDAKYQFLKILQKGLNKDNKKAKILEFQEKPEYESIYDHEVNKSMRQKFPPNYHVLMNKSRIQAFLCEKRLLDKKKRFGLDQNQKQIVAIPQGTLSIMINKVPKQKAFQENYNYIPQKSKFKMKWKVIQWLTENKTDQLIQLCKFVKKMMKQKQEDDQGLLQFNLKQFETLFNYVQLGGDQGLTDKLFFMLDTEKTGQIDSRELVISMEMLMNHTIEQKIQNFIEMCHEDEQKGLNLDELINNKKIIANRKNVYQVSINDQKLRQILHDSIENIKKIDFLIENDLEPPFYINNTISNINGTYYRQQDCLINLMQINYNFSTQNVDNWKLQEVGIKIDK